MSTNTSSGTTIFDVAKYILDRNGRMSTWKLQKLCYYAQAWSLAWTEEALFDQNFQAWSNGPVCPELFHAHKGKFMVSPDELKIGDTKNLSKDQIDTIDRVLEYYGEWEPYELREQTHHEAPWVYARKGIPEDASSNSLSSKSSMGEYYGSL